MWTRLLDEPAKLILTPFCSHGGPSVVLANFGVRMWQSWLMLKYIDKIVFILHQVLKRNFQELKSFYNLCCVFYILILWGAPKNKTDSIAMLVGLCWISLLFEGNSSSLLWKDNHICSQTDLCTSPFHLSSWSPVFWFLMWSYFVEPVINFQENLCTWTFLSFFSFFTFYKLNDSENNLVIDNRNNDQFNP